MKNLWEIIKSITIIKLLITKLTTIKPFIAIRNSYFKCLKGEEKLWKVILLWGILVYYGSIWSLGFNLNSGFNFNLTIGALFILLYNWFFIYIFFKNIRSIPGVKKRSFATNLYTLILIIQILFIVIFNGSFNALAAAQLADDIRKYSPLFLMIYHFKIDSQLKTIYWQIYDNLLFNPFLIFLAFSILAIIISSIKNKKYLSNKKKL